jgi:ribosome biogenesis SPOUT family RNA methylase Rps3
MKKTLIVSGKKEIKKFSIQDAVQTANLISGKIGVEVINVQDISATDFVDLVSKNIGPFHDDVVAIVFVDLDMEQSGNAMTALTRAFHMRTSRKIDTYQVSIDISGTGAINKIA